MVRLLRATLTNVRNYAHLTVAPDPRLNVLSGPNGSGKTNLLEAVSLLQPGRGLRAARPELIPRHGASSWAVASRLEGGGEVRDIGTGTNSAGLDDAAPKGRVFRLDGANVRAQAEIAAIVSVVWLTPQMERLFGEAASGRRRFLDRLVGGLDAGHARALAAHDAAVAGRNRLLAERRHETAWLRAAEDAIARHATAATASRLAFCRRMNLAAEPVDAFPAARLDLSCPIAERLQAEPARLVEDWLRATLAASRDADTGAGTTAIGAHRCDLAIHEHATGLPAHLASTGQQKSLLVGIVLAHASLIEADRGEPPLLLLDEPLVHLDADRRRSLFVRLSGMSGQVLMTGTDEATFGPLARDAVFWRVGGDTVVRVHQVAP